jgi:sugar O-acyltransferase (sialic acid O-acetyltransferase NeuD family)
MGKSLVIFGCGDFGELAHYYFNTETDHKVVAFAVDAQYINESSFCDLPVVAFEDVAKHYPPETHNLFVALAYSKVNLIRKQKFYDAKKKGYELVSFVSSKVSVPNNSAIGQNCFIFEDNTIQPFVRIGNNVTLWSGNHIGHHSVIQDHTFIASHAVISGRVVVGEQCFIGVNATLRDHIKVGDRCVIGAGALILSDTESEGVYLGAASERSRVPSSRLRGI